MFAYTKAWIEASVILLVLTMGAAEGAGLNWEKVEPDIFEKPEYTGSYGGLTGIEGHFYMWVSLSGNPAYAVFRSPDGITWQEVGPGTRSNSGFGLSNGKVLLYGLTDEVVIGQGEDWKVFDAAPENSAAIHAGAEGDGQIVLCGGVMVSRRNVPAWWVSTDGGESFVFHHDPDVNAMTLETIIHAGGKFVAGGTNGAVWTSEDGESWIHHVLPTVTASAMQQTVRLLDIVHVDGYFYAVGSFASLWKSENGEEWELLVHDPTAGPYNYLDRILVDGNNWYAAGPSGDMIWSADGGTTWEQYFRAGNLSDLTGGDGRYYAGGHIVPGGGPISPERDLNLGFWEWFSAREIAFTQGKWLNLESLSGEAHLGTPEVNDVGFLDSATTADGVYYQHPWFGWYALRSGDWAYHYSMGWIYCPSESNTNVWIYTVGLDWIFTSSALWPYFYHLASGHWALYAGGPNWFWNETLQAWMERDEFYQSPWPVSKDWLHGKGIIIFDTAGQHTITIGLVNQNLLQALMFLPYPGYAQESFGIIDDIESTVSDTSRDAGLRPGSQFTFSFTPLITDPVPEPNELKIVLTFTDESGGTSSIQYDFGAGFQGENIEGTFQVSPDP